MVKLSRARDRQARRLLPGAVRHRDRHRAHAHSGWPVLPLSCHSPDNAAIPLLRDGGALQADDATPSSPALRFVADVVAPVAAEKLPEEGDSALAAVAAIAFDEAAEDQLEALPSDGELAALGALICILSAVATLSTFVWLMAALA